MKGISHANYKLPTVPFKKLNPKQISSTRAKYWYNISSDAFRHDVYEDHSCIDRDLQYTEVRLQKIRARYDIIKMDLNKQWYRLHESERTFRGTVVAHNKFVKENLEKRLRAIAKSQQNQSLIETRQKNIEVLQGEIKRLRNILQLFRYQISRHGIYERFLDDTVQYDALNYKSINSLVMRYVHLQNVKENLLMKHVKESQGLATCHRILLETIHSTYFIVVGLRNDVDAESCKYEQMFKQNLETEILIINIIVTVNERLAEMTACMEMIDFIYQYICRRRQLTMAEKGWKDLEEKSHILKQTLLAWKKISGAILKQFKTKRKKRMSRYLPPTR